MDCHRSVRMDLMSSREVQKYLRRNDMVILPVGCFEMHGPDIPLACDALVAWATAILLAESWKCLALPPVYYTFPGATGPWPGTVDLPISVTQSYVAGIVEALVKNGFKRVVIQCAHAPLRWTLECVVRDVFQRTGVVAILLGGKAMGRGDLVKKALGFPGGEDVSVLGALKVLGLHGAYDPSSKVSRPGGSPFASLRKLTELGAAPPWTYSRDYQHTGIRRELKLGHADAIARIMRESVKNLRDLPRTFARYQREVKKLYRQKPWSRSSVWTRTK